VADIHFSRKSLWNKKSDGDKHLENLPTLFLQHGLSIFDNFSCGIVDFLSKPKNQKIESVLTKFPGNWNFCKAFANTLETPSPDFVFVY